MSQQNNYVEETQPLYRLLEIEAFRFVIVRCNHYSLVAQLQYDLQQRYPQRPFATIDGANTTYRNLVDSYYNIGSGFFYIHNFRALLNNSELYAGLNQRRDKLAQYPIAIIAFIEPPTNEQFAVEVMEKMPDLWSFRSLILDLKTEITTAVQTPVTEKATTMSSLGGNTQATKQAELDRLLTTIAQTGAKEKTYLNTLYEQVVELQKDLGKYKEAIETYNQLLIVIEDSSEKARLLIDRGDTYSSLGLLKQALSDFEEAKALVEEERIPQRLGVAFSRIGNTFISLGNLPKALEYYELYEYWAKKSANTYPHVSEFKRDFAIANQNLGEIQESLGNLVEARSYYEKYLLAVEGLVNNDSYDLDLKHGLSVANEKIGNTYLKANEYTLAFKYYQRCFDLAQELYNNQPNNVEYINGLAIANEKMGDSFLVFGNQGEALNYYKENVRLTEVLVANFNNNVNYKSGLASAYVRLASVNANAKNLNEAVKFYKEYEKLRLDLFNSNSDNIVFKNGLAIAYYSIGNFYLGELREKEKAIAYYTQSKLLLEQLIESAPDFADFKRNLDWVNESLAALLEK